MDKKKTAQIIKKTFFILYVVLIALLLIALFSIKDGDFALFLFIFLKWLKG